MRATGIAAAASAAALLWLAWPAGSGSPPDEQARGRAHAGLRAVPAAPEAAGPFTPGASAMATLPAPPNAPDDAVAIAGALAARWDARPEPSAAKPPERARLPARRRGNPAALERAFERMPRDPEWLAHQDRVDRERRRLEPRGIAVVGAECRTQACRFELV